MPGRHPRRRGAWPLALAVVLLGAACGTASSTTTAAAPPSTATSVAAPPTTGLPDDLEALFTGGVAAAPDCSGRPATGDPLAELDAKIAAGDCGVITSLAVWHDGETLIESHYRDTDPGTRYGVFSVTKSVTSAMVGLALADGLIGSLDDPMLGYLPRYDQVENRDARKEAMTVEDLLTMRTGLEWPELSIPYGDPTNPISELVASGDWVKFVLDREMSGEPGLSFNYNSGASILLSGMLQVAAGRHLETYAASELFGPLGIKVTDWRWERGAAGRTNAGWGLFLTTGDMVKFGRLYLQGGEWEGQRVIPADWVEESTRPHVAEAGFVRSPGLLVAGSRLEYGYHWWRFADGHPVTAGLAENDVYFAWGYGGNFIFVVPHLELVVATTAENFDFATVFFAALRDFVFPAVS